MPKLYEDSSRFCSNCFQQIPGTRMVEFEAAWDGPVTTPRDTIHGVEQVQIDDLVICEVCLTAAAKLIGLVRNSELEHAKAEAEHRARKAEKRNTELHATAERLAASVEALLSTKRVSGTKVDGIEVQLERAKELIEA
jgi:hypothetical protein